MFECLEDHLDLGAWKKIPESAKIEAEFKQFHVTRAHKPIDNTTYGYMIAEEDGDPKTVELKNTGPGKDPLKNIGSVELRLNADETEITGIDIDGDIFVK